MARPDTSHIKTILDPARHVTILLPQAPQYDAVAAGLALRLSLDAAGKSVAVACSDPMTVEFNHLVGIDNVSTNFGARHLVISFPGQTDNVDKVSYNVDKGELQLVITPKADAPDLDHRKLKIIPGSAKTDLVILIGVEQLLELGPLYNDARSTLSATKVVSVTRNLPKENYTSYQVFDPDSSSLSELMVHVIDALGLQFHPDVATNLLAGLDKATNHFQSPIVSHSTFEMASHLLRRGARRHTPLSSSDFPTGSIPQVPYTQPQPQTQSYTQSQQTQSSTSLGYGTDSQATPVKDPPPDWYEPKVYRGPMLP
jgi:hypothetical protein